MTNVFNFSRGIPTHRGWVKKIRFAPGKGNQKLLVMYTDGAEVWDTKEVSLHAPSLAADMSAWQNFYGWLINWFVVTHYKCPACMTWLLCITQIKRENLQHSAGFCCSSGLHFNRFTVAELMCFPSTVITEALQYSGGVYLTNVLSQTTAMVISYPL